MTRFLVTFPLDVDLDAQSPQTEAERRMRKGPGLRPVPLTIEPAEGMRLVPATDRASVLVVDNVPVGILVVERNEAQNRHVSPLRRIGVRAYGLQISGHGDELLRPQYVDGTIGGSAGYHLTGRESASVQDVVDALRDGSL